MPKAWLRDAEHERVRLRIRSEESKVYTQWEPLCGPHLRGHPGQDVLVASIWAFNIVAWPVSASIAMTLMGLVAPMNSKTSRTRPVGGLVIPTSVPMPRTIKTRALRWSRLVKRRGPITRVAPSVAPLNNQGGRWRVHDMRWSIIRDRCVLGGAYLIGVAVIPLGRADRLRNLGIGLNRPVRGGGVRRYRRVRCQGNIQ